LRTKQEAREQRRRELQEHIDGYERADADTESIFDRIKSYRVAGSSTIGTVLSSDGMNRATRQKRRIKTVVGFVCYSAFVVADLLLIGLENIASLASVLV